VRGVGYNVEVSPEGVLLKLGSKPVYFSGQRADVLLKRPEDVGVQGVHLVGGEVKGSPSLTSITSLKGCGYARQRREGLRHVFTKGALKRPLFGLLVIALLCLVRHLSQPIRNWGVVAR